MAARSRWLSDYISEGEPLLRDKRVLYQQDDFKMTLYSSPIDRVYLLVVDGGSNLNERQEGYMLRIPADWTEYSFQLHGIWCKLWYDEDGKMHTETWSVSIDEEFETVAVDPNTKSMPGQLPWQVDDDENIDDLDDLLVKIDAALLDNG